MGTDKDCISVSPSRSKKQEYVTLSKKDTKDKKIDNVCKQTSKNSERLKKNWISTQRGEIGEYKFMINLISQLNKVTFFPSLV